MDDCSSRLMRLWHALARGVLLAFLQLDGALLGFDRAVNFPSVSTTLSELQDATQRFAAAHGVTLGTARVEIDSRLSGIVGGMCRSMDASRALSLGMRADAGVCGWRVHELGVCVCMSSACVCSCA